MTIATQRQMVLPSKYVGDGPGGPTTDASEMSSIMSALFITPGCFWKSSDALLPMISSEIARCNAFFPRRTIETFVDGS